MTPEEYIKAYTRGCSNELIDGGYHEWLTPENALAAVEMAREEMKKEPISEDLDETANRYAKEEYNRKNPATLPDRCRGCYAPIMYAFKAGAQWQRDQMMKDAISGIIFGSRYFRQKNIALTNLSEEQYDKLQDFGERVKVITFKE